MEVRRRRVQGWMAGAALSGVYSVLLPLIVSSTLGWAGALLGALPALLIPRCPLPRRWEKTVEVLRLVWSLPSMALVLGLCADGVSEYSYPGWDRWVPALLMLLVAWRGSKLDEKGLERCGKLVFWLILGMCALLAFFFLPQLELRFAMPRGWGDGKAAGLVFLIMAGASAAVMPATDPRPGLAAATAGAANAFLVVAAEGAALAGLLRYPFLVLCDAAAFEMRLGPVGCAIWALSVTMLVTLLLSRFPGGKWARAVAAAAVLGLTFTRPWPPQMVTALLIAGAILGYLPPLAGLVCRYFTGKNYI